MESRKKLLDNLYEKLLNSYLISRPSHKRKSLYLALIDLKSKNKRRLFLQDPAAPKAIVDQDDLDDLIKADLAEVIETGSRVTLTSKGIWEAEVARNMIDLDELLQFIENKYFNCFGETKKSLTDWEKAILFTTLAARSFSIDSPVDLNDERTHDGWKEAVNKVYSYLFGINIINDKKENEKLQEVDYQTSLSPIIHFFRYSANLPKATDSLFIAKNLKYYLNLSKEKIVDLNKIAHLYKLIFENYITLNNFEDIYDFCTGLAYDINSKVYFSEEHFFTSTDYDLIIKKVLRDLALKKL